MFEHRVGTYIPGPEEEDRRREEGRRARRAVIAEMRFVEPLTSLQEAIVDGLLQMGGVYSAAAHQKPPERGPVGDLIAADVRRDDIARRDKTGEYAGLTDAQLPPRGHGWPVEV